MRFRTCVQMAGAAAFGAISFLLSGMPAFADAQRESAPAAKLEAFQSSAGWRVDGKGARLLDWKNCLAAELDLNAGESVRLDLKTPVELPAGADMMSLTLGTGDCSGDSGLRFRLIVSDSRGAEYGYKANSPAVDSRENYFYPSHPATWAPLRLTIPGLQRPVIGSGVDERNYTIEVLKAPASGPLEPQPPLTLKGISLTNIQNPLKTKLYIADAVTGHVDAKASRLHYLINGHERFAEIDGLPWLSLGTFGPSYGESYRLVWTVRDRYEGRPFLSGEKTFETAASDPERILTLNERIVFPIEEKGTYWINVRRLWNSKAGVAVPDRIDNWDFRLDVLSGKPSTTRKALQGAIPGMSVVIGPERRSFVFGKDERPVLEVGFSPAPSISSPAYRVTATAPGSGETLQTWEGNLAAPAAQTITIDLGSLNAGAVRLRAELLSDGRVLDRAEQLVGLPAASQVAKTRADPSADWHKLADGKSLIYVGMSKGPLQDAATRLAKVKALLDEAGSVSHLIEYEFRWSDVEPLPGVFDWSEIDAVINYAREKGQSVLLWPSFIGAEPDWIPPAFQRKSDGTVTGTRSYLFQGGRINYWHSREMKEHILRLCRAMATRYRGNPTVHGYYLLVEHGGDNPWFGFFPGYEPETVADYHSYLKEKYKTDASLDAAWGRATGGRGEVTVPGPAASDRERLDWNEFRSSRLMDFFVQAVREIRAIDPYKLMMIYTGAADGGSAAELAGLGCMLADGGAASPIDGGPTTMGYAAAGLGRRTEEISVTQWAAQFPTQLDASLFNLTLGGGRNANAKMFFTPGVPLEKLRNPKNALDRFERFIPIWQELAPTEPMPWEAFLLKDAAGGMLLTKSTAGHSDAFTNMVPFDAHVLMPAVPMSIARQGKMIFLQPRISSFELKTHDEIADYVKSGGRLVLCANSGRFSPDLPGEDWVLLRRLGITPPSGDLMRAGTVTAIPSANAGFPPGAGAFKLTDAWRAPASDAVALATYEQSGTPAITRHQVGQGTVDVIWANAIIPPTEGGGYPFFRDLADAAGVTRHSDSSAVQLWTNLLRNPTSGDHYGTVYHAAWNKIQGPAITGRTFWKVPEGSYQVTELITGRELGVRTAAELAGGIETSLGPREVAVYRFKKL